MLQRRVDALSNAAAPHPSPFFVFFQILRDTRDVVAHADEQIRGIGQGGPIRLRLMSIDHEENDKSTFHVNHDTSV